MNFLPIARLRKMPNPRSAVRGLTLVELLVALVIFSILGILSYRAVSEATASSRHLTDSFQRWRDIANFVHMTETDMMQIVVRPVGSNGAASSPSLVQASGDGFTELRFLRLDGAHTAVRRRGYQLSDGRIVLMRWNGGDDASPPARDVILDNVHALRFGFLGDDGTWHSTWPPSARLAGKLPSAIDMELELDDAGTIHRIFAIR